MVCFGLAELIYFLNRAYKARITVNEFAKTNAVKSQSKVKMLAKSFISSSKAQANQPEEVLHLHKNPIM